MLYRWYLRVAKARAYRAAFCEHFLSKVDRKINIENYIMYNSSVENAVVY